jgi:hypothetical protein
MNTDLHNYVKVFKNLISHDLSNEIILNLEKSEFTQHFFEIYDDKSKKRLSKQISGNKELDISFDYRNPELEQIIWNTILQYIKDVDLPWFQGWSGYSFPRWNKYKETKKMALHVDSIKSLFDGERKGDPTLSILGLLHHDFTGGEFHMIDRVITDFQPGDIIVFPSNFLYPHKVDPVISGERYSFISWTW